MHWHTYWTAVGCTLCDDAAAVRAAGADALVVGECGLDVVGRDLGGEGRCDGERVHVCLCLVAWCVDCGPGRLGGCRAGGVSARTAVYVAIAAGGGRSRRLVFIRAMEEIRVGQSMSGMC